MITYIIWTCKNKEEAKKIIHRMLEQKLIACASFFPVESHYVWKEKIENSQEIKVILKTKTVCFDDVINYIQIHCSYEVPEIVEIPIKRGNPDYFDWIIKNTCK